MNESFFGLVTGLLKLCLIRITSYCIFNKCGAICPLNFRLDSYVIKLDECVENKNL